MHVVLLLFLFPLSPLFEKLLSLSGALIPSSANVWMWMSFLCFWYNISHFWHFLLGFSYPLVLGAFCLPAGVLETEQDSLSLLGRDTHSSILELLCRPKTPAKRMIPSSSQPEAHRSVTSRTTAAHQETSGAKRKPCMHPNPHHHLALEPLL